eukprot:COSAG01_NODE_5853_length_3992_cov_8.064475_2_plen_79_part_00
MQNNVGELYSLVRFLRMDPFAYYFCKKQGCGCKTMCYGFGAMSRKCIFCGCSPLMHYSKFNRSIINPINRVGYVGARL